MKTWKVFLISSLTLLMSISLGVSLKSDCGPFNTPGFYAYTFLQPSLVNPIYPGTPYFLDYEVLYARYGRQANNQENENILEWQSRYCQTVSTESIRQLVYKMPLTDLEDLSYAIENKRKVLPIGIGQNSFASYLLNNRCKETVDYLIYAKNCEPYVVEEDAWELQDNNTGIMNALIERGLKEFMDTKSFYIRLRYAYQIIRLAHYLRDYPRTLKLYDFLMPKIDNDPSIIEYWILGHKAGALLALDRNVEASYLYSKIFEESFGKRESAYRSFSIKTEEEWQACLLLCKDDKERATLYALRANAPKAKALEDMKEIYRLDPSNNHLEVLLLKELKQLEKSLLGLEYNPKKQENRQFYNLPTPGSGQYVIELQTFVRNFISENPKQNPALWKLALGYLETLAGDNYDALKTLKAAKKVSPDDKISEQIEALSLVALIDTIRQVSEETETIIARIKLDDETYNRFPDFKRFIEDKMSWLYKKSGDVGKLYLQQHNLRDLKANPDLKVIDELIAISEKSLPNRLERDMIRKNDGSTILNDLIDIKGTYLLGRGEIVAALEEYKKMDLSLWEDYGIFNPFEEHLIDCVNCAQRDSLVLYSKPAIVERILDYEYKALANRQEGAQYFYRIGLAYYNMSYFGYAWNVGDFFRSGSSIRSRSRGKNGVVSTWQFDLGNLENFNTDRALVYFEKVIQLTNNKELAARAAFMAAKCEQNQYYLNGGERTYKYFNILVERYSDTQFYQRAISECKYFNAYTSRF